MIKPETPIYLDHSATTPTDLRVVEAMLPYFTEVFGNPLSAHSVGRKADKALTAARRIIADVLGCSPRELIFTGCGSESDNLALRGVVQHWVQQNPDQKPTVITTEAEHHAISHTARALADSGQSNLIMLPVDSSGRVRPDDLRSALQTVESAPHTLVSIMLANNEIGTVQPIAALAQIAHEAGALFHTDAVQGAGQLPIAVRALDVDMLSITAHKFYGPKGIGCLYVREGTPLDAVQTGGGQERDRRAGTHAVALIVGMAKALELACVEMESHVAHYRHLRDRVIDGVLSTIPDAYLTGSREDRLANHASFVFDGVNGNTLLMHLDMHGIAASSGSACNTGNPEPSDVLLSLGLHPDRALGSLRVSVGKATTEEHIDYLLAILPDAVRKLRAVNESQGQAVVVE